MRKRVVRLGKSGVKTGLNALETAIGFEMPEVVQNSLENLLGGVMQQAMQMVFGLIFPGQNGGSQNFGGVANTGGAGAEMKSPQN